MSSTDQGPKQAEILLVEDNPADIRLVKEALKEGGLPHRLHVVTDGELALDFFYTRGAYVAAPRPNIVLLDFNLPKKDGREILAIVKNDPDLQRIPIIVMTTSRLELDVMKAYDNHANAFISKPVDFEKFIRVVGTIQDFWLDAT